MNVVKCPSCGARMKRNGLTSAGRQRWRCPECGKTSVARIDSAAKRLGRFLRWLLSRERMADMPGGGRGFRRDCGEFWSLWPVAPEAAGRRRVVYVDAIHLERGACVLVACDDEHVLGWVLAASESIGSYRALLSRIAAPDMVVTDGGRGFPSACRAEWPGTAVQRCLVHVVRQIRRYTTKNPRSEAGSELWNLALVLPNITTREEAAGWGEALESWHAKWAGYLAEETLTGDGRRILTHARLVTAGRSLRTLVRKGTLFTYIDGALTGGGDPLPNNNNRIEGGVNAQLRAVMRDHRGMCLDHRLKAAFWWCLMHTADPPKPAELLHSLPRDADIERQVAARRGQGTVPGWGDAAMWAKLHPGEGNAENWD